MSLLAYFKKLFDTHPDVPQAPVRQPMTVVEKVADLCLGQQAMVEYRAGRYALGTISSWNFDNPALRRVSVTTLHDGINRHFDPKNVRVVPLPVTIPVISSVTITEAEFAQ